MRGKRRHPEKAIHFECMTAWPDLEKAELVWMVGEEGEDIVEKVDMEHLELPIDGSPPKWLDIFKENIPPDPSTIVRMEDIVPSIIGLPSPLNDLLLEKREEEEYNGEDLDDYGDGHSPLQNGVFTRPNIPYSQIIRQALLESPRGKLLLREIYARFESFHPYYTQENKGWRVPMISFFY